MEETVTIKILVNSSFFQNLDINSNNNYNVPSIVDDIFLAFSMLLAFGANLILLSGTISVLRRRHIPADIPLFLLASLSISHMLDGVLTPILLLLHICIPYAVLFHWFSHIGVISCAISVAAPHPWTYMKIPVPVYLAILWLIPLLITAPIMTSLMPWGSSPSWAGCSTQPLVLTAGTFVFVIFHAIFALVPMLVAILFAILRTVSIWKDKICGDAKHRFIIGIAVVAVHVCGALPSTFEAHIVALKYLGTSASTRASVRVTAAAASFWLRRLEQIAFPVIIICICGAIRNTVLDLMLILQTFIYCPKWDSLRWDLWKLFRSSVTSRNSSSAISETMPETTVLFATVNGLYVRTGRPNLGWRRSKRTSVGFLYKRCDVYDSCCAESELCVEHF